MLVIEGLLLRRRDHPLDSPRRGQGGGAHRRENPAPRPARAREGQHGPQERRLRAAAAAPKGWQRRWEWSGGWREVRATGSDLPPHSCSVMKGAAMAIRNASPRRRSRNLRSKSPASRACSCAQPAGNVILHRACNRPERSHLPSCRAIAESLVGDIEGAGFKCEWRLCAHCYPPASREALLKPAVPARAFGCR